MEYKHEPVMLGRVMEYLNPRPGGNFIDCTLGGGGYSLPIAEKVGEKGSVLSIDLDKMAIRNMEEKIKNQKIKNIIIVHSNFRNLQSIVEKKHKGENIKFDGIVFDLGLSSAQLADRSRGFSFQLDSPLKMEFGGSNEMSPLTTINIINNWPEKKLVEIIKKYGEERFARRIAKSIVEKRKIKPLTTTKQLVDAIGRAVPEFYKNKRINFATRTFQALRITTNEELENLETALPQALNLLKRGGRLAVISYHSLEDRIVKNFFKKEKTDCLCPPSFPLCQCGHKAGIKVVTSKAESAGEDEIKRNPRSRSAKLRVAEKK